MSANRVFKMHCYMKVKSQRIEYRWQMTEKVIMSFGTVWKFSYWPLNIITGYKCIDVLFRTPKIFALQETCPELRSEWGQEKMWRSESGSCSGFGQYGLKTNKKQEDVFTNSKNYVKPQLRHTIVEELFRSLHKCTMWYIPSITCTQSWLIIML